MIDSVEYDASQATLVHNTPSSVSSDMLPFSNHNFPVEHPVARKVLARAVREVHFRKLHQTGVVVANNRKSLPPTNCNEEEREWGRSVLTSEQLVNEERERSAQEGGRERGTGVCLAISTSTHPPQTILLPPLSDSDRTVEQDTKRQFLIEVVQPAIFTRIRLPNSLPLHPTKAVSSTETSPRVLPHTNAPASNDVDENDDEAMEILLRSPPTTRLASPTKERADVARATAENEDDELAETRETERSGR
ncbi:hypothetical protein BLNAU_16058 [Blattamonas nauphoetae]|uniref:Uncharacterized protein n=1 Tax=Blattamonas nauphoetae TaxID=2049346 RepID=A0ABQ9X8Z8_9EUKA|nr:hypothetical protein BLNAU_16058 [Blattamonas nauphoetae]